MVLVSWPALGRVESAELQALRSRLASLDVKFLSWASGRALPLPTTASDAFDLDAFLVLGHSAVEAYLEEIFTAAVDSVCSEVTATGGVAGASFAALHWTCLRLQDGRVPRRRCTTPVPAVDIQIVQTQYGRVVRNNHGVAPSNVAKMLEPFDLALEDVMGGVLVGDLSDLASARGGVAHGAHWGATVPRNAMDEALRFVRVVNGLRSFEFKFAASVY